MAHVDVQDGIHNEKKRIRSPHSVGYVYFLEKLCLRLGYLFFLALNRI